MAKLIGETYRGREMQLLLEWHHFDLELLRIGANRHAAIFTE